jgi:hypothetical protein
MSTKNALLAIACGLLVLNFEPALAQQPSGKPAAGKVAGGRDHACAEDAKKFCSKVRPGGGRVYQCLSSHDAELAPACREQLSAAKARFDKFMQACKSDIEKACKTIPPGQGRVLSCLKGREDQLTPECRAEFPRARGDATLNK